MPERKPEVSNAHEFLEITRDFTDPKDVIREAISNSMDWGANSISIKVTEDRHRAEEDLIIEIEDNGVGLNEERLFAFFDLGHSTSNLDEKGLNTQIGYKGHGTKTYYNSHKIEIESKTSTSTIHATMVAPLQSLIDGNIPVFNYEVRKESNHFTGTKIRIFGYNMSKRKEDFGHSILKDYILWKTKFGSVEKELDILTNSDKILKLQGLGESSSETIRFGHRFPPQNSNLDLLRKSHSGDWTKYFCKRWVYKSLPVIGNPGRLIDIVFYVEGDEVKRTYNPMITGKGRVTEYGMYKVEDRYGIWVCKDFIPIKQVNEWLGLGKRLETKYHAFVNCQDLRLTANRGDIGNTPPDLLTGLEKTVKKIYDETIVGSTDFQYYEDSEELEQQYQTGSQERKDFERRRKRALSKKVCTFRGVELIEPSLEMGVIALFNILKTIETPLFPFRVIDYDSKRGYDAIVSQGAVTDLSRDTMFFIEFKYSLEKNFNHAFTHLTSIVTWDCLLSDGSEVVDIENRHRELRVSPPNGLDGYTKYMLVSLTEINNIEVFVLKDYLREKLKLEFRPRTNNERM